MSYNLLFVLKVEHCHKKNYGMDKIFGWGPWKISNDFTSVYSNYFERPKVLYISSF